MAEGENIRDRGQGNRQDPAPKPEVAGKRYLLTIAIDCYTGVHGYEHLDYPVEDAKELTRVLQAEFNFEVLPTLENDNCTKDAIENKLNGLRNILKKEDQLVVFFAGHGNCYIDVEGNTQ